MVSDAPSRPVSFVVSRISVSKDQSGSEREIDAVFKRRDPDDALSENPDMTILDKGELGPLQIGDVLEVTRRAAP
jgi:hypothetical protein